MDVWVHLNCALWSLEVYETLNGALMNVDVAVKRGTVTVRAQYQSTASYVLLFTKDQGLYTFEMVKFTGSKLLTTSMQSANEFPIFVTSHTIA